MTCRDFVEFLMDYLNGDVSPDERRVFDEHLVHCDACRNYLATYQQSIALAQQADTPAATDIPPDLMRAILAARKK